MAGILSRYVENGAFGPGERLVFSIEYGIVKAGTGTLSVTGPEQYEGLMAYRITANARSNPSFSAFFRVDDTNSALLDIVQFHTLLFSKELHEGNYHHLRRFSSTRRREQRSTPRRTTRRRGWSRYLPTLSTS